VRPGDEGLRLSVSLHRGRVRAGGFGAHHRALPQVNAAAGVGPSYLYPDPQSTPGATNPQVTQANIEPTIYAVHRQESAHYDEDHFISIELDGNPRDTKNLWPEMRAVEEARG